MPSTFALASLVVDEGTGEIAYGTCGVQLVVGSCPVFGPMEVARVAVAAAAVLLGVPVVVGPGEALGSARVAVVGLSRPIYVH